MQLASDVARERQASQQTQIDGLDGKAATLLGFVGVALALLIARDDLGRWPLASAAGLLALAVLFLGFVLWPRSFKANPRLASLMRWSRRGDPDPHLLVAASIVRSVDFNERGIAFKTRGVQAAELCVGLALVLLAAGVLTGDNRESRDKSPQHHPEWRTAK
ncbi:MAG TPA: hypothetical protein VNB64_10245 [Solirubrobacteraceae bacterium]|nr:hypothetical protein [Solirubrobacteraceae bacterium]